MKKAQVILGLFVVCSSAYAARQSHIVIENTHVRYSISAEGKNLGFVDRASGIDHLRRDTSSVCALVRCSGVEYPANSLMLANNRLTIKFSEVNAKAVLRVESHDSYIRLVVESVSGDNIESLVFLNIPLTLKGLPNESFGSCALSLNLITRVNQLPALQTSLQASCYNKFGMERAKVAIVAMPMDKMLTALKQVLTEADEMPHCSVAVPWAKDVPFNRGSYLFNFGALTESRVDEWIEMANNLGVTQIDNHGGRSFFRFGDFVLGVCPSNRILYSL